ncbi:MAG: MmgE/PrpD family protein, partial [Pseudomonadota bacterium]
GRDHYQVGFHQTATAGAFGATLAVGRVLGLDEDQIVTSLGLAATKAAGLKTQFGTMGKPLNAGLAAETGVLAAQWASAGLTSTERGLSGALGFAATHDALCDSAAFDTLGTQWLMQDVSHKFHACCHGLHAMLEALQDISAPVDVMTVYTHPRWLSVCSNAAPRTGLEMKFSYKMTAAMRMAGLDTARIDSFSDAHAMDPTLKDLADRVTVVRDPDLSEMQCRIEVTGGSGCEVLFHDLQTPMTLAAREARLQSKGRAVVGAALADDLWAAVKDDDVAPLMGLITRPSPV